jgi:hypothetical protein
MRISIPLRVIYGTLFVASLMAGLYVFSVRYDICRQSGYGQVACALASLR